MTSSRRAIEPWIINNRCNCAKPSLVQQSMHTRTCRTHPPCTHPPHPPTINPPFPHNTHTHTHKHTHTDKQTNKQTHTLVLNTGTPRKSKRCGATCAFFCCGIFGPSGPREHTETWPFACRPLCIRQHS